MPDEPLQVIRYTTEPRTAADDRGKPWIWMDKLRLHYTGSIGNSLLTDEMCCNKSVFGLQDGTMRDELLKVDLKSDGAPENMQDGVAEAETLESAQKSHQTHSRRHKRNCGTSKLDKP